MQTIKSQVNPRLLSKADRLFTGSLSGRITEVLQNARRAGATRVEIINDETNNEVVVRDNGSGIDDFAALLDLGGSNWEESLEASEDPAGVGVFCLAPRRLTVRSCGKQATIEGEGWYGADVPVTDDPDASSTSTGTQLRFTDDPWSMDAVEPLAVFSGLEVIVDGTACASMPFIAGEAAHLPELGCRLQVVTSSELSDWHRRQCDRYWPDGILVNFHGQTVHLGEDVIGERGYVCLVDLTGEPTGLRLMLPARTQLVENDTLTTLLAALEVEVYRFIAKQPSHTLPYRNYVRARELGVELPEAKPVFRVGLQFSDDIHPEPCEVRPPEIWPLHKCYRLSGSLSKKDDAAEANAHLLAALGTLDEPFVPVTIHDRFNGYSWAKLPTIDRIDCEVGADRYDDYVGSGRLGCVESITLTAHTGDGKVFRSNVMMAADEDRVYVTEAARDRLLDAQIWFQLGGYCEEGDTYETQEYDFSEQLNEFWRGLVGPDEHLRARVYEATSGVDGNWQHMTVNRDGTIVIQLEDGSSRELLPPPLGPAPGTPAKEANA